MSGFSRERRALGIALGIGAGYFAVDAATGGALSAALFVNNMQNTPSSFPDQSTPSTSVPDGHQTSGTDKNTTVFQEKPKPQVLAHADIAGDHLDVTILDDKGTPVRKGIFRKKDQKELVGIFGVNGLNFYTTGDHTQIVPIEQLQIVEGNPFPENFRWSKFGIRCDEPNLIIQLLALGAANIRIAGSTTDLDSKTKTGQALYTAKNYNLSTLFVFNPTEYIPPNETKRRIKNLKTLHPEIEAFELGNEPDFTGYPFWKDRNLDTFAQFVTDFATVANEEVPQAKLVLGALVDQNLIGPLLDKLLNRKVDLSKFYFGVHVYDNPNFVTQRINIIYEQAKKRRIDIPKDRVWITEMGVDSYDKKQMEYFIKEADKWAGRFYIHELPKAEKQWGIVDLNGNRDPYFYRIAAQAYMMKD